MNFEEIVNKVNLKKAAVISFLLILGFWVMSGMIIFGIAYSLKKGYSHFVTQFDQDQQSIHNIIEEHRETQKAMSQEMKKRDREMHAYVEKSIHETFAYLNKEQPLPEDHVAEKQNDAANHGNKLKITGEE